MPRKQTTYQLRTELAQRLFDELMKLSDGYEFPQSTEDLIDEARDILTRGRGSPRGVGHVTHRVTADEFAAATRGTEYRRRGKAAFPLNVEITNEPHGIHLGMVQWSCPQCAAINVHYWYGRAYHVCGNCGLSTDIKGATVKKGPKTAA